MSQAVPRSHKLMGLIAVLFGIAAFIPIINFDPGKMVVQGSNDFIVRYSLVSSLISGGLIFMVPGILNFIRKLASYCIKGDIFQVEKTWGIRILNEQASTKDLTVCRKTAVILAG